MSLRPSPDGLISIHLSAVIVLGTLALKGATPILEPDLLRRLIVGAAAVAVMRRKEREVRDAFRDAGAISPATAMSLEAIQVDENMAVRRLKRRAVIREAAPGLLYFDEDVWKAVSSMRRRMALLMLGTVILIGIMVLYGSVKMK